VHAFLHVPSQLHDAGVAAMRAAFASRLDRPGAERRRIDVFAIDAARLDDPVQLVLNASAHIGAGRLKLGAAAMERARVKPLLGTLALRPGEAVETDSLRVAFLVGVAELDAQATSSQPAAQIRFG
jgi:hypothetical protein